MLPKRQGKTRIKTFFHLFLTVRFCRDVVVRRLNQSRASSALLSSLIAIKFGSPEARRLNWALELKAGGRVPSDV